MVALQRKKSVRVTRGKGACAEGRTRRELKLLMYCFSLPSVNV